MVRERANAEFIPHKTSVMRSVVSQCLAKLGVPLWSPKLPENLREKFQRPDEPTLLLGMDVNHDPNQGHSTVGFCSSVDFKKCFSQVASAKRRQELVCRGMSCVVFDCLSSCCRECT